MCFSMLTTAVKDHHRKAHKHHPLLSGVPRLPLIGVLAFSSGSSRGPRLAALEGLLKVVKHSRKCNEAQLVVDEMGDVIVPT